MKHFISLFFIAIIFMSCASTNKQNETMIADIDPFEIDVMSVGLDKFFLTDLTQKDITIIFHPRTNEVSLKFSYDLTKHEQYWDESGRQQFIQSVAQYFNDFDNKLLIQKSSKTTKIYGRFKAKTKWGVFQINSISYPEINIGYVFKKENPYFTTTQYEAKNSFTEGTEEENSSTKIVMYFTKAQAENLANIFNQSYLLSLLPTKEEEIIYQKSNPDTY